MAGDYLPLRLDLRDDPAVITMAAELSVDQDAIVGKLAAVWSWANRHTADGYIKNITAQWLDAYVSCAGFAAAMARVRWLEVTDDGVTFPHWDRWNGKNAKMRLEDAQRQREYRAKKGSVTKLSRSPRDKNVTTVQDRRGEDRREGDQKASALGERAIDCPTQEITAEHVADAKKIVAVVKPSKRSDYVLVARAVLSKSAIGENALWDSVEAVKQTTNTVPAAYFQTMLRNHAPRFDELAAAFDLDDTTLFYLFADSRFPYLPERRPAQTARHFSD